ncbi:MAG: hypothetical protein ACHP7H_00780 [Hyphomicrobiales bacterium]
MIVGRSSRSQIVGAAGGGEYAALQEFTGAGGPGAPAPPIPFGHPAHPAAHPHHPHHHHHMAALGYGLPGEGPYPLHHPHHPHYAMRHPRGVPVAYERDNAPTITEVHPTHPREFPIGFSSEVLPLGVVAANQTQGIEQKPQVLFRGERLAVPNSIVLNFDMEDIKVGKDSQLASPGSMPSECFSNLSVGVRMQLDTAEPGITITLFVTNNDPINAHVFKSVLYGTVIE